MGTIGACGSATASRRRAACPIGGPIPPPALESTWEDKHASLTPPYGADSAMVYDSARGRSVYYNGAGTWAWDGTAWTEIADDAAGPRAIRNFALTYDAARDRVVLFGGETNTFLLDETWELDGNTWSPRTVTARPSPRRGPALGYDEARQRVVLFGGHANNTYLDDLWEWDGTAWIQRTVTGSRPGAVINSHLIYVPTSGGLLLDGGNAFGEWPEGDPWLWNGASWSRPIPRLPFHDSLIVFDDERDTLVAFGGERKVPYAGNEISDAVVQLVGTQWIETPATGEAPSGSWPVGTYDRARHRLVIGSAVVYELSQAPLANRAPKLTIESSALQIAGRHHVFAGETLTVRLAATDADGHAITFAAANLPSGAALVGDTLRWTPTPQQAGTYSIAVAATDGQLCASRALQIVVRHDDHEVLPAGNIVLDGYVPEFPMIYWETYRCGLAICEALHHTQQNHAAVRVRGNDPGKVIVELDAHIATPDGPEWTSNAVAILDPNGETFAGRFEPDVAAPRIRSRPTPTAIFS